MVEGARRAWLHESFSSSSSSSKVSARRGDVLIPSVWPGVARSFRSLDLNGADRAATRANVLGSRLLPTHITAKLQSGSPPGAGVCIRFFRSNAFEDEDDPRADVPPRSSLLASVSSFRRQAEVPAWGPRCGRRVLREYRGRDWH
jgi:hypothetical protein